MIICGFGTTRLIGGNIKITENFLNVIDAFCKAITVRCGKEVASDLLFACTKFILLSDAEPEVKIEAKTELLSAISKLYPEEVNLTGGE